MTWIGSGLRFISDGKYTVIDHEHIILLLVPLFKQLHPVQAFGPIMPIMKFSTDEEVVKLANDSKYGLGCAVFSGSKHRAKQIGSQLRCGVVAINDFASNYMCQVIVNFACYDC